MSAYIVTKNLYAANRNPLLIQPPFENPIGGHSIGSC